MDGLITKYFVLKPGGSLDDPYAHASRSAMLTYAELIEPHNHELYLDLVNWVQKEERKADKQKIHLTEKRK